MKDIKELDLKTCDKKYFSKAWDIYLSSFPSNERRTLEEQKKILEYDKYTAKVFIKDDEVLAILFFWKFTNHIFCEHFAINEDFRGQAYGSRILKDFIKNHKNIVLEIEPIKDELSQKRYNFYKNLAFVKNDFKHFQVPFRKGDKRLELLFLSLKKLKKEEYCKLYFEMEKSLSL